MKDSWIEPFPPCPYYSLILKYAPFDILYSGMNRLSERNVKGPLGIKDWEVDAWGNLQLPAPIFPAIGTLPPPHLPVLYLNNISVSGSLSLYFRKHPSNLLCRFLYFIFLLLKRPLTQSSFHFDLSGFLTVRWDMLILFYFKFQSTIDFSNK